MRNKRGSTRLTRTLMSRERRRWRWLSTRQGCCPKSIGKWLRLNLSGNCRFSSTCSRPWSCRRRIRRSCSLRSKRESKDHSFSRCRARRGRVFWSQCIIGNRLSERLTKFCSTTLESSVKGCPRRSKRLIGVSLSKNRRARWSVPRPKISLRSL